MPVRPSGAEINDTVSVMSRPTFELSSAYAPTGDQPQAIAELSAGVGRGERYQTLLGVTGSGKTFTMANIIAQTGRPALVIAHNKTLAAQLCNEFREFFPANAVEYFVSYYDYYQPEAYIASTDTYIEKDSSINDEIDRLRHAATASLLARRDVVIVASVSCIYGIGSPEVYRDRVVTLTVGEEYPREALFRRLVEVHYQRNDTVLERGRFRVRGDAIEIQPADAQTAYRISMFGDEVESIAHYDPLTGEVLATPGHIAVYPATHYVTPPDVIDRSLKEIRAELEAQVALFESQGKLVEAHRLRQRTEYDMEMIRELGFCSGIENYSRILDGRAPGTPPHTLIDFFPDDFVCFIDESHNTMGQLRGMYEGDRSRKLNLIEYGFRIPAALDNRPLQLDEFLERVPRIVFVSATPGAFEQRVSGHVVEQIIRPTGLVDPEVDVRTTTNQIDDLIAEVAARASRGERALVTTLTKRMAEDLTEYLTEAGLRARYLHSEIDTLERIRIVRELRLGQFDVLVGVNLLREGLDLPEVTLVAILDADKEGFLRGTPRSSRRSAAPRATSTGRSSCTPTSAPTRWTPPSPRPSVAARSSWPTTPRTASPRSPSSRACRTSSACSGLGRTAPAARAGARHAACGQRSATAAPRSSSRRSSISRPRCSRPPRSCGSSRRPAFVTRSPRSVGSSMRGRRARPGGRSCRGARCGMAAPAARGARPAVGHGGGGHA